MVRVSAGARSRSRGRARAPRGQPRRGVRGRALRAGATTRPAQRPSPPVAAGSACRQPCSRVISRAAPLPPCVRRRSPWRARAARPCGRSIHRCRGTSGSRSCSRPCSWRWWPSSSRVPEGTTTTIRSRRHRPPRAARPKRRQRHRGGQVIPAEPPEPAPVADPDRGWAGGGRAEDDHRREGRPGAHRRERRRATTTSTCTATTSRRRRARASRRASTSRRRSRASSRWRAMWPRTPGVSRRWRTWWSSRRDADRPRAGLPVGPSDPGMAVRLGRGDGARGVVRGAGRAVAGAAPAGGDAGGRCRAASVA